MISRPEDFKTIDCNDGITIEHPGTNYEVFVNGRFFGSDATLWGAMQLVEVARAGK